MCTVDSIFHITICEGEEIIFIIIEGRYQREVKSSITFTYICTLLADLLFLKEQPANLLLIALSKKG